MSRKEQGFTLIELSIVLVIIGLIVGGILVGQDLIKASEIRAAVAQIEKYNSAVNTFRGKYNGLPGDLTSEKASSFGFVARVGTTGQGDGNGLIEGNGGTNTNMVFTQEAGMFWNDLSVASLIDGNFTTNAANQNSAGAGGNVPAVTLTNVPAVFPLARMGRGNYITVGSTGGSNYWLIAGISGVTAVTGAYSMAANMTPIEAYNIDIKVDDGMPNTGAVQQHGTSASTTAAFTDNGDAACISGNTSADTYIRTITAGGNQPNCILRLRFN